MDYYNEFDPFAAEWIRNLMDANLVPRGVVDTRSIEDVRPSDLKGFRHVHFFAGIAGWAQAMQLAGWPDDSPLWTGSCPCQPFSQAGQGTGFADERHLWPAFHWLISQCFPAVVVGEQVASKDGLAWLDLVQTDVEKEGYAFGAVDTCAAGFGAPHIRQRLYWVADTDNARLERWERAAERAAERPAGPGSVVGGMADASDGERHGLPIIRRVVIDGQDAGWPQGGGEPEPCGDDGRLADANDGSQYALLRRSPDHSTEDLRRCEVSGPFGHLAGGDEGQPGGLRGSSEGRSCPTNGFWRDADWLYCRDDRWRPVEPGTFPLVNGLPRKLGDVRSGLRGLASIGLARSYRVGALKGYGNAIVTEQAAGFLEALL